MSTEPPPARPSRGLFLPTDWQDRPWRSDAATGPDSVSWRIFSSPAVLLGAARASLVQLLYPPVAAGVDQHSDYLADLHGRAARTLEFGYVGAYGDQAMLEHARDVFVRVHERVRGIEPLTGQPYSGMDLEHRRYVAVTAAHSFLLAYQELGGRLTHAEIQRFVDEVRHAGTTSDLAPGDLPGSRTEMRDYLQGMRDRLATTETSRRLIAGLLRGRVTQRQSLLQPAAPIVAAYGAALMPRHLQRLAGIEINPLLDRYGRLPALRLGLKQVGRLPADVWLARISPTAAAVRRWAMSHAARRAAGRQVGHLTAVA